MELKIISFDPSSYRNLGCAIATISSKKRKLSIAASTFVLGDIKSTPWHSLWPLFQIVDQFLEQNKPDVVILEKTSSFAGGFVTGQVSNCIGAILAACGKNETFVEFVYPTHVKKVISGKGKCTKSEMRKSVISVLRKMKCDTEFDSEHAYDAIAGILCFMNDEKNIKFSIADLE